MLHWLWFYAGLKNGTYVWYLLWSGIMGVGLVGSGIWHNNYINLRKHNCHVKGCWRLGRHPVDGTSYVVCRRHHPDDDPTHAEVLSAHREANS